MNFKNKKFKYGSLSILLTAVIIAVVILLNVVISALFSSNLWYIYNVDGDILQISSLTDELFAEHIDEKNDKIEIVFLTDKDRVNEVSAEMKQIHELAKLYEDRFEFIDLRYVDFENDPEQWLTDYLKSDNISVTASNVIVKKAGADAAMRILHANNFLVKDTSTNAYIAFAGERCFTMRILSLYASDTVAYVTTGHGEKVMFADAEKDETAELNRLKDLLENTGFTVKEIDLTKEDISDDADLVVIAGPTRDFNGTKHDVNEIQKLTDFCNRKGSVMAFVDPGMITNMPNLDDFLSERGIEIQNDMVYEGSDYSVPTNSQSFYATFVTSGQGSGLTAGVRDIADIKTIFTNACTIKIGSTGQGFHNTQKTATVVSSVLSTSRDAQKAEFGNGGQNKVAAPYADLMVLMQKEWTSDNNKEYSYILACGSSSYISDASLSGSYANDSVMYAALRAMAEKNPPAAVANIEFVNYADNSLIITNGEANTWMIIFAVIIPLLILTTGMVIYFKRRHR